MLLIAMALTIPAQTWKQITAQTEQSIAATFFLNTTTGWYVGAKGLIRKTVDGGKTWNTITTNITEDLKAVHFADATTGFITSATKLYKSTDGFATNTSFALTGAVTSPSYHAVYFSDAQNGWVLSSTSSAAKILQTVDGGTTWTNPLNHTSNLQSMTFFNGTTAIAGGGGSGKCDLFYTKDGKTWTKGTSPTFPAGYTRTDIRGVYMQSKDVAYATGWGSLVGAQASIYLKSIDGGATWTYQTQQDANKTFDNMYDFYFKDSNNGLAVGGGTKAGIVAKTTDAGVNWVPIDIPCGATITDIFGVGDNVIVATGGGSFLGTKNFGATWELLTAIPVATLNSIHAVNNNVIYAGGQDGLIMKTTDGGKTWKSSYQRANGASININGLYFTNENVGYTANSYSMIAKTVDGGNTWSALKKDSTNATTVNYGVHFINDNTGFIAGKDGTTIIDVIYKTTNGGTNFNATKTVAGANLRGIAFFDLQSGIAVGEKLKALYTKDGGATWLKSTFNGVPTASATATLREVSFVNSTTAVAVGDKVILRSTDSGANWNYITVADLAYSMTGVAAQGNTIWAVGAKSASPKSMAVYQSADGGLTWTNKATAAVFDSTNAVYDVTVTPSGSVFVCGGKSVIYSNSTTVGIEEHVGELPTAFELKQNYPNPFNPETTISYKLQAASNVSLKVYDVLGREVATLVNEFQQPSNYKVRFNVETRHASSLPSGVYFYTLKTGDFTKTMKMLLLK
jgi:photosystem II stability/assembly factor-like uncharacterized protein